MFIQGKWHFFIVPSLAQVHFEIPTLFFFGPARIEIPLFMGDDPPFLKKGWVTFWFSGLKDAINACVDRVQKAN
jgi:hypothetical protein